MSDPLQTDTLQRLPNGSRVAVIRLRSLGDCVLSTPAISLLKAARPDLEIAVVAESRFAPVFDGHPAVGQVLTPSARALRGFSPDLCLNLHGGSRSARLTALSGAEHRAGFNIFRPGWIYNLAIPTAQEVLGVARRVHTAEHMAAAVFHLGVPISEVPRASLPAPAGLSSNAPASPYAVIHPLAATPEKTWPAANFLELARFVRRSMGIEPIFIGAAGEDLSRFQSFPTLGGAPLEEVARLMRDAVLFIGNDSGPAHIAASFGIPQVVFFGPSDEEIWSPWQTEAKVLKSDPIHAIDTDSAILALKKLHIGGGTN
ncbi:MAG TPA: glycosyltransferase family 9 protein [Bryobacteraceae bacterium]|nr:glycosyltransferase family 9 protein [Bryobacteraceae bacterium]